VEEPVAAARDFEAEGAMGLEQARMERRLAVTMMNLMAFMLRSPH
jgi:hypothetical protein